MQLIDIIYCYKNKEIARVKNSLDSLALQTNKQFSVIFIDYGSDKSYAENVKEVCDQYAFCKYYYINTLGQMWNRADALNHGFKLSDATFVFTSDIDMIYKKTFIDYLFTFTNNEFVTLFFAVGYLNKKQTNNIDTRRLENLKYNISKNYALGMMFTSKKIITQINGYNSFYAIWGVEDNDIKGRIETAGLKTEFINNTILMLHQYHTPANNLSAGLPIGWKQYLADYHADVKNQKTSFNGINEIFLPKKRPALNVLENKDFKIKLISSRKLFIRHSFFNDILNRDNSKIIKYSIDLETHQFQKKSTAVKFIKIVNLIFSKIKIPIDLVSMYNEQYITKKETLDEIYFFLKSMENYIEDYCIQDFKNKITLVIIKK